MTRDDDAALIRRVFGETIALHQQILQTDLQPILDAVDEIAKSFKTHGKLLLFGNGGSAADASHAAAELVGRFERERNGLPAIALTTDSSILTSVGNDLGFEMIFARQIDGLGRRGDVALGITTSGTSPNVLAAFDLARRLGLRTIALTGADGGKAKDLVDVHINVPSESTARAQEVHRTILHVICALVEARADA